MHSSVLPLRAAARAPRARRALTFAFVPSSPFRRARPAPSIAPTNWPVLGYPRPIIKKPRGEWADQVAQDRRSLLLLAIAGSQLTKERSAPCRGDGSRKVELDPTGQSL